MESLGEEIKNKAEKNKCLQDLERSNNSSKSYSIDEIRNSEDVILRSSDNSLLARVQKAQEDIRKDNASDHCKNIINLKNTPTQNQHKEKKIFGTPSIVKDFKFKTPTSGKTTQSTLRTAHYSSGNHFGTKINHGSGPKSIPSYQRDTKASTLKRSPAKVIISRVIITIITIRQIVNETQKRKKAGMRPNLTLYFLFRTRQKLHQLLEIFFLRHLILVLREVYLAL